MPDVLVAAVNLNSPGTYLHWNIFTVSEANLVLILVMLVIFGVALVVPFPGSARRRGGAAQDPSGGGQGGAGATTGAGDGRPDGRSTGHGDGADYAAGYGAGYGADYGAGEAVGGAAGGADATATMWTARVRRLGLRLLPPGKLLPDSQPAYVASWVYVFGVATLAALGVAIVSGFAIALGGPDWWHYDAVGHFFNSLHLWSVELFMAFMVIHLWGKFWMAAWRGRRTLTWITGVVAFMVSVIECFTGYLSQQNFDSQWISTSAKDAFNGFGVGTIFRAMNFGQMLLLHVVLIPLALVAIVGGHILLVRVRGVSHPLPARRARGRAARRAAATSDAAEWRGPTRRYDILKEGTIAGLVALIVVVALAAIVSSPDVPPVTVQSWAHATPGDFMATSAAELAGTSETATYGPPYNNADTGVQTIIFSWQRVAGVGQPIDASTAFVLSPLSKLAPTEPSVEQALTTYEAAPASQQNAWNTAYLKAVSHVTFTNGVPSVPSANDGPVPVLIAGELNMARSGALDADLLAQRPFYGTDYTKPLLFIEDGAYFSNVAADWHLLGTQWGVMNETGSYPGQPWLWLYDLWYQVPGWRTSANVDMIAIYMTSVGTILLLAVPFIPGLRDIPRYVPVHRLIWRSWNRSGQGPGPSGPASVRTHGGGASQVSVHASDPKGPGTGSG